MTTGTSASHQEAGASREAAPDDRELRRRDDILDAVGFAAHRLLGVDASWESSIDEVLARLGEAAGVSRVYIFENHRDGDRLLVTQRHEWTAAGVTPQIGNPCLSGADYEAMGWGRWVTVLGGGDVLHARTADLPPQERAELEAEDIVSIALVPIMVGPQWWGHIGFDDCADARDWRVEISALRAAASTLSAAIQQQRTRAELLARIARDDAERARAYELLEQRIGALAAIAASLTVDQDLTTTLQHLAAAAVAASTALAAAVEIVDAGTGRLSVAIGHGLPDGYTDGLKASWDQGVDSPSTRALHSQELRFITDARMVGFTNPGFAPLRPYLHDLEWDDMVAIPLDSAGRSIGVLNLYYRSGALPAEDEVRFLRAVADQGAVAVENARLLAEAQHRAGLEERQRLARELHDSVSQALYGIALGARTARTLADRDPTTVVEPLDYVLTLADAALTEMRALIFELRPESLADEGLVGALTKQAAALRSRHDVAVEVDLGDEPDVPLGAKEALYRIAQEALHNTTKHAQAKRVAVSLASGPGAVTLVVSDDGVGFDPGASYPGHLGLSSMRERAALAGGSLTIDSGPGRGTRLTVALPVPR